MPNLPVERVWGLAAVPVRYESDDLGRMSAMQTYRTIDSYTGETFPEGVTGDATPLGAKAHCHNSHGPFNAFDDWTASHGYAFRPPVYSFGNNIKV